MEGITHVFISAVPSTTLNTTAAYALASLALSGNHETRKQAIVSKLVLEAKERLAHQKRLTSAVNRNWFLLLTTPSSSSNATLAVFGTMKGSVFPDGLHACHLEDILQTAEG